LSQGRSFVGFVREHHARKEAEERTLAALKEVTDIKAALDDIPLWPRNRCDRKITHVNDKFFARFQNIHAAELLGQATASLIPGTIPRNFFAPCGPPSAAAKLWRGEILNRAKDGSHYWVDTTIFRF